MTTVLVVDDHALVRESIVKVLTQEEDFRVVGEAGDATTALALAREHEPDIVLLDVGLDGPNDGVEVARSLRRSGPPTRIVFLTMYTDESTLRAAVGLAADGFIPKTTTAEELVSGLRVVAGGGSYLSPSVAGRVMAMAGGRDAEVRLTDRELDILRLLSNGCRPKEIAERLYVSVKTVKNHLTNVYAKLGVSSGAQAVAEAYQRGLTSTLVR